MKYFFFGYLSGVVATLIVLAALANSPGDLMQSKYCTSGEPFVHNKVAYICKPILKGNK